MTSGTEPLSEPMTGTPHAIASTMTRPNCSTQPGVVCDGTSSTSQAAVHGGQVVLGHEPVEVTRDATPCAAAWSRSDASSGPVP